MAFNIFAMPASSIILLLSAAFGVSNALPWSGPAPTGVYKEDAWSPRPTSNPADPLELFKRDSVDIKVCGWIGGASDNPAICPTGSSCIHDTAHGYVGCCTTSGSCTAGVYTSCVDKNSPGGNSGQQVINNGVFTCPGEQECYRNTFPGNYYQWGCGSSDQATTVETSFTGQPSDLLLQVVFTGVTFKPMTLSSTSTSSSAPSSSTSASATSDSTSSSDSSSSAPSATSSSNPAAASATSATSSTGAAAEDGKSKQKSNVGPIAGGTIGGLAFLIAILGIILFFYRRRQSQRHRAGSFISTVRKGSRGTGSTPGTAGGPFHKLQPYSPDDFVSPMSEGINPTPPMNPSAFQSLDQHLEPHFEPHPDTHADTPPEIFPEIYPDPHLDLYHDPHPAVDQPAFEGLAGYQPPDHTMFSPTEYRGIEERMRENAAVQAPQLFYPSPSLNEEGQPFVSEIDNFSHSFHAAIAQMSPPTPPQPQFQSQSRDPESSNVELPPPRDTHIHSGQYPENSGRGRSDGYGRADAEDKETGLQTARAVPIIRKTVPGFRSENVRMEGWQPASLRPAKSPSPEPVNDSTPRYQLVDQPPLDGVPVLHSPGQLRGNNRHQRQKSSY